MQVPVGRSILRRYRGTIVGSSILLAASQLVPILGYDIGTGWLSLESVEIVASAGAIVFLALVPFCLGLFGTRHYGKDVKQSRTWWYVGALASAVLGAVGVIIGILQMRLRQIHLGESETVSGTYLAALLGGMVAGIWVGAFMGWIGHLVGRLTVRLGV